MTTVNSQQLAVTSKRGTKPLFRSIVICLPLAFLLFTVFSAEAQQPKKIPRIGYLTMAGPSSSQALLQGLRDLGYVEGQNIAIEYRSADGKRDRLSDLADELVRLKVDIIVADGTGPSLEAKKATRTIPIVMTSSTDPIGNGLIASFSHPGGAMPVPRNHWSFVLWFFITGMFFHFHPVALGPDRVESIYFWPRPRTTIQMTDLEEVKFIPALRRGGYMEFATREDVFRSVSFRQTKVAQEIQDILTERISARGR